MRAGAHTVHQSLTAEAAAVLKLSLGLARRRGHAQVTPLHVAYTLLGASEPSSPPPPWLFTTTPVAASTPAYGLLRGACARSRGQTAHPAQCRALELCFNIALNRLPTGNAGMGSSPSTSFAASLLQQPSPTLSNALVAALKRAQANQRRGCVDLQSPPGPQPQSTSPTQQQPILTIKVDLDQLIISILDDPSVSRVMREAGFSSAAVKTNLEEESAAMLVGLGNGNHHGSSTPSSSPAPPAAAIVPPHFFLLEPYGAHASDSAALWAAPFLNHNHPHEVESQSPSPCKAEDARAILEVMARRQGRRANPVVLADSVSVAEASVAELLRRMERGDVPDELLGARVLRLNLSHVHVRLMTRADVDAWAADLRRSVGSDNTGAGLVIYVGDMRWAVDSSDDARGLAASSGFSPAAHLAAELARLLGELRLRAASHGGRAWLVAAASYGTFMRCQRSSLEVTWDLQPVSVPAGAGGGLDLELGPRAATARPADRKAAQQPAHQLPLLDLAPKEEDGVPMPTLCAQCAEYYESEASAVRAKAAGTNLALTTFFPGWPQVDEPQMLHQDDDLMELKWKWSRLCQLRVHSQSQWNQPARPCNATASSNSNSNPAGLCLSFEEAPTFHGRSKIKHQDVKTTLSLLPDSIETSDEVHRHESEGTLEARSAAQEPDAAAAKPSDIMKSVPWLPICELLPSGDGDLKRKAESVRMPSESKRWKGSGGGLDLNLRADDEEEDGGGGSSEDELVPSDLTNDGEAASGDVTDSLDSHRQAAVTFDFDH